MWQRLWQDESGIVVSLELILAAILISLGMLGGLQILRDAAAQELADVGMAIGAVNNSYTLTGMTFSNGNSIAGSSFADAVDAGDTPSPMGSAPAGGMNLGLGPQAE